MNGATVKLYVAVPVMVTVSHPGVPFEIYKVPMIPQSSGCSDFGVLIGVGVAVGGIGVATFVGLIIYISR